MTHNALWRLAVLTLWLIATVSVADAPAEAAGTDPQLLSGDRVLLGTVEEVRSDQARINIGEVSLGSSPWTCGKIRDCRNSKREIWSRSRLMIKICWSMCIWPVRPATIVSSRATRRTDGDRTR